MVDEKDIFIAAGILIRQHGDSADAAASERINEFTERGDLDGAAVWQRIHLAVRELAKYEQDGPIN